MVAMDAGFSTSKHAKILAFYFRLKMSLDAGSTSILVETDAQAVICQLQK